MKIYMIKTNKECYITDCKFEGDSDYNYNNSRLHTFYFDKEKANETYCKNWYVINKYPTKIEKSVPKYGNVRYEIYDTNMVCEKFPETILLEELDNFEFDVSDYYARKQDRLEDEFEEVEFEIEVISEMDSFKLPNEINFNAIRKGSYKDESYVITNKSVQHQMMDKMLFPEIMLHTRPCKLTSKQIYDITRQHIKDNIDLKVAKISSDYDFCFAVKKIVPLIEPENIAYTNVFARTKRERSKIHYSIKEYKEVEIYSMTHKQENYKGYTAIEPIVANNQDELNDKVNEWLNGLMEAINKPLEQCSHCRGTGYAQD